MAPGIAAVSYALPGGVLTNDDLVRDFPDWNVEKIASKTGITARHVLDADRFTSDLAADAVRALVAEHAVDPRSIDYLIVCTQTPDLLMPNVAQQVHGALGLPDTCGAVDVNLGCSGYVYSLGLATGLIASGQAARVVVVTADTYTRLLNPADRSVRTLFGDGASATLVTDGGRGRLHGFVYGTDGAGGGALTVPGGGLRTPSPYPTSEPAARGLEASGFDLHMDGPEIFTFTLRVVPPAVARVLERAGIEAGEVDTWIFHQANAYMLAHLRRKLAIPEERFVVDMADVGNTVSSTIPIALARAITSGRVSPGSRSVLLGFGVGLSWAGVVVDWADQRGE